MLLLLAKWDAEYFMDTPSTFYKRSSYVLKTQSHDPDTPTYMEALSGKNSEEYFKAMRNEIHSLMIRDTWEIVLMKSVADHNVFPGTWSFKCKSKPDWTISKFKARYCVRGDIQKILSPRPLNLYSPVVQWSTVRLILILQCIIGLQSQSIDFTDSFDQVDIPSGYPFLIELTRYFNSDGGQDDVVLKLKKSIYGQARAARLWYGKLRNGFLDCGFVMSKVDLCLFMSKSMVYVVYVDNFLFWAGSQSNIYNIMKSFKEDGPSYNW